jgi:hypothetical protein
MTEVEWLNAGFARNKKTGRWHAVFKDEHGEMVVTEQSFETREKAVEFLKEFSERIGGDYRPIQ